MTMPHRLTVVLFAVTCLAACGGEPKAALPPGAHVHADGTVHLADDKPAAGKTDDHAHGERTPLGSAAAGGHTFEVVRYGNVEPGAEMSVDLDVAAGKPLPTVRGWIGDESGKGSMKVKFDRDTDTRLHGHPTVPTTLAADAKLWLEVEAAGGAQKVGVALRR
jgi:hypothetical protein